MNNPDILGDYIKSLENKWDLKVSKDKPFIIRLDGHRFSKFTKGLNKPQDLRFIECIVETAKDLVDEFLALTAFVESDEITLVFPSIDNDKKGATHIFNGRILKLCSLTAGYASMRFNYHLNKLDFNEDKKGCAYFDSRIFEVETNEDLIKAVNWRYRYDTYRNGVNSLASTIFTKKELYKKSLTDVKQMLKDKNVLLENQPKHLLYGTFIKKKIIKKLAIDYYTKQEKEVERNIVYADYFDFSNLSEEKQVEFIMSKHWPE